MQQHQSSRDHFSFFNQGTNHHLKQSHESGFNLGFGQQYNNAFQEEEEGEFDNLDFKVQKKRNQLGGRESEDHFQPRFKWSEQVVTQGFTILHTYLKSIKHS